MIDSAPLAQWMDAAGLPGAGERPGTRLLSGGTRNEIYEITRGEHRWALRIPPQHAPAGTPASCGNGGSSRPWTVPRYRIPRPLDYIPGLMHGDYQFANVMYRTGAPARLAAIVDWEMGTVGDPELDLAWMVQSWPADTADPGNGGYVDMRGMPARDRVVAHYAEVSGRQVDDLDYYLVLAKWKLAIVLEQGFQRAGEDGKLQSFGPIVPELMRSAAELAGTTEYTS